MKNSIPEIDDLIFDKTEKILALIKKSRNRYINEAIEYYNSYNIKPILESE
jgi:hypothetical protein